MTNSIRTPEHRTAPAIAALTLATVIATALALAQPATAAVRPAPTAQPAAAPAGANPNSLEAAASKAGETGRKVATSLIALAFAIAAVVLTFKRDFKEAVGVFAIGIVAVLLVSPAGINVLHDTVTLLFGGN